ncbi:hypothetical protein MASR2M70_18620 [Bacillota bacterium]
MIYDGYNHLFYIIPILIISFLIGLNLIKGKKKRSAKKNIQESLALAGYSYDPKQDIFYSNMDAWQRSFGYSRIYDEAAAPLSMIIDCEPVRFNYGDKKWLIEFWKGQYGMATGCEAGIYTLPNPPSGFLEEALISPDGLFYNSADESDQLYMSLVLKKNGRVLFSREGRHWWLTGFIPGEFSQPHELHMEVSIAFKEKAMCYEFVKALQMSGYSTQNMKVIYTTVWISFLTPFSLQPRTRTPITDSIIQKKNQFLCRRYQELTAGKGNGLEKLIYLWNEAPELYESLLQMGKPLKLFKAHGGGNA